MLYEYAVDPELVATWSDRTTARYFRDQFGLGSPRIISKYPGRWKRLVWAAWESSGSGGDTERKRMEELLAHLSRTMVKRPSSAWNPDRAWQGNALREHRRLPFHAILAQDNPGDEPRVLVPDDLDDNSTLWTIERGQAPVRRADAMAETLRDMLRLAMNIVFVDPYFAPDSPRYLRVLSACLEACRAARRILGEHPSVHIITSGGRDKDPVREHFEAECRKLPASLPVDQPVTIRRVAERPKGQQLHNRYVLTEHGGVSLGAGLDEKTEHATDDVLLLPRNLYLRRWREYAGESLAFDRVEGDITIVGQRREPLDDQAGVRARDVTRRKGTAMLSGRNRHESGRTE